MPVNLVKLYKEWEMAHLALVSKANALLEGGEYLTAKEIFDKAKARLDDNKKAYDKARHALPERLIADELEADYNKLLTQQSKRKEVSKL